MKKITLSIFLMTFSLGYSQVLPLDFSEPADLMTGFEGCVFSIVDDGGNSVGQVVGGGQFYDHAQITLAENLNLSDNANNTITFRIKPAAGSTTGSHLLKFENGTGGPATCELPFTTTGTAWQNITLNFGAGLGIYSKVVLFTDFANNQTDTYLFDDLAGGTNVSPPPPLPTPPGPAPIPTLDPSTVISMYGESYPNTYLYSFGSVAGEPDLDSSAAVNLALKFNFASAGYGSGYTETNVSAMQYVHFDYWTPNATTFNLYLISNSPVVERIYTISVNEPIQLNTWKSVNIPLSYFTGIGFNPVTWFQYKFDVAAPTPGTVYIDNVYFTSSPLGVNEFDNSVSFKMYPNPANDLLTIYCENVINDITIYNTLGQLVTKQNSVSNEANINISALAKGVYVLSAQIGTETIRKQFIKE